MYSTHNEEKTVVAKIFTRNLKCRVYKYMTSVLKNVYIVTKHNNIYHRTIKMKPVDIKDNTYVNFGKEINDKDPKFQVGDHVRISKYKNIFAKGYTSNWSEEVSAISKVKNTVPWTYVINDLNDVNNEEIIGTFYEKELQKTNQIQFRIEKVIKKKKETSYTSNGNVMITHLTAGLIKKTSYKMSQYFPKPYEPLGRDNNV